MLTAHTSCACNEDW